MPDSSHDHHPVDTALREAWGRWCREAGLIAGMTYEEVCARLADGGAVLQITFVATPPKRVGVP